MIAIVAVLAFGCSGRSRELAQLEAEAALVARENQPALDALVARVAVAKRRLRGNLPNWQTMLRTAELANDELGLPPFEQEQPAGPAWRASPATLLGIAASVRDQTRTLAAHGDLEGLRRLVADERRRYAQGLVDASDHLAQVERALVAAGAP